MKLFLISAFSVCMFVLSGCMSVSEPEAPALTAKFATEAKLHLDGFQLYSVRSADNAGNLSEWSDVLSFDIAYSTVQILESDDSGLSWSAIEGV